MMTTAKGAIGAEVVGVGLLVLHYALRQSSVAEAPRRTACTAGDAHTARARFQEVCDSTWIAVPDTSWPTDAVADSVDDCIIASAYESMTAAERLAFMAEVIASGDQPAEPVIVRYGEQTAEALAAAEALSVARCRGAESSPPCASPPALRTKRPLTRCPRTTPLAANAPPVPPIVPPYAGQRSRLMRAAA